jgi:hypothetical protein
MTEQDRYDRMRKDLERKVQAIPGWIHPDDRKPDDCLDWLNSPLGTCPVYDPGRKAMEQESKILGWIEGFNPSEQGLPHGWFDLVCMRIELDDWTWTDFDSKEPKEMAEYLAKIFKELFQND